jgi:hypothetical protein
MKIDKKVGPLHIGFKWPDGFYVHVPPTVYWWWIRIQTIGEILVVFVFLGLSIFQVTQIGWFVAGLVFALSFGVQVTVSAEKTVMNMDPSTAMGKADPNDDQ